MKLLLASSSAHKVAEIQRMLDRTGLELTVVGLGDVPAYPEPVENGASFEDNAMIKAEAGFADCGWPTLADDSGIEVDVLNRMPGIRSARWAGVGATDQDNLDLLLRQLADVEPERRTARYVCAMALVTPVLRLVVRGVVEGRLATQPRGDGGFGYDPIFLPEGGAKTAAELAPADKDAISHRGRALAAILPALQAVAEVPR